MTYIDWLWLTAVLANFGIMIAYMIIGVWVWKRLDIAGPKKIIWTARFFMSAFFATCAMTHLELATHSYLRTSTLTDDMIVLAGQPSIHFIINHVAQFIAAVGFAVIGTSFTVHVFNRSYYHGLISRRMEQIQKELVEADVKGDADTAAVLTAELTERKHAKMHLEDSKNE